MNASPELLIRYLEDRESLSDAEWEQLVDLLREQPALASELREQLMLDDFLSQKLAGDRVDFIRQMAQRIGDYEHKVEETFDHVAELRAMAEEERNQLRPAASSNWQAWAIALSTTLALILLSAGVAWWMNPLQAPVLAVIEETSGEVTHHGGKDATADVGDELRIGEKLHTSADSSVTWRYADGTRIRLEANAVAEFRHHPRHTGKHVELSQGALWAHIAPQLKGKEMTFRTPQAEAQVLGTEFRLAIRGEETELEVTQGVVSFQRNGDLHAARVVANEMSVASPERMELKTVSWPSQRDDIMFLFTNAAEVTVARNPQSNGLRETPLEGRGQIDFLHDRALVLGGGSFASQDAGEDLRALFHEQDHLTVELIVGNTLEESTGMLLGFRAHGERANWSLSQQHDNWLIRLLTDQTKGEPAELKFAAKSERTLAHVAWTYRPGAWKGYLDGNQIAVREDVHGSFRPWESGWFTVGADADQQQAWRGTVYGIAVYRRVLEASELQRNSRNCRVIYGPLAGWEHM